MSDSSLMIQPYILRMIRFFHRSVLSCCGKKKFPGFEIIYTEIKIMNMTSLEINTVCVRWLAFI